MTTANIYDVYLESHGKKITVNDIHLTPEEGDKDDAIYMAIEQLRDKGIKGCIEYITHDVRMAQ